MDKQNNKSIETQSKFQSLDKKSLVFGGIIVLFIAIIPFIFYSYESFPSDSKTWETFLFSIETKFPSVQHFAWFFSGKFVPLYILFLWFFTCKHWWHWIILVPIAMYTFQLYGIVQQNKGIDEVEKYYLLPIMMILIPMVYLIRAKLFNQINGNDLRSFERDLSKKRTVWWQIKDLFR